MADKEIINNLNATTKLLSKVIKSNCLPADLEIEVCNLRFDILSLLCKLQMTDPLAEEWQCP